MTRAALAATFLLLAAACGEDGSKTPPESSPPKATPPVADPKATVEISQIMVAYEPVKPRTHDQAFQLATRLVERAKSGEKFENLILEATDDLNADTKKPFNDGNYTLALKGGRTDPVLIKYVRNLEVGEVGQVPYDSGQALLVVRRNR